MEFKSEQKHILISPRKLRPIADIVKKMTPVKAVEVLPFIKRRGSEYLYKVVKSALANANQKLVDINTLVFKEIQIGEGPRLKRGQPVSRGRWHPIKKRMSHVKVILETVKRKEIVKKVEKKTEGKVNEVSKNKVVKTKKVIKKEGKNNK
jgi:large subunit ribosomal protein L22